jgi:hypothetical protein
MFAVLLKFVCQSIQPATQKICSQQQACRNIASPSFRSGSTTELQPASFRAARRGAARLGRAWNMSEHLASFVGIFHHPSIP